VCLSCYSFNCVCGCPWGEIKISIMLTSYMTRQTLLRTCCFGDDIACCRSYRLSAVWSQFAMTSLCGRFLPQSILFMYGPGHSNPMLLGVKRRMAFHFVHRLWQGARMWQTDRQTGHATIQQRRHIQWYRLNCKLSRWHTWRLYGDGARRTGVEAENVDRLTPVLSRVVGRGPRYRQYAASPAPIS